MKKRKENQTPLLPNTNFIVDVNKHQQSKKSKHKKGGGYKGKKERVIVVYEKLVCSGPQIEYVAAEMEERLSRLGGIDEETLEQRKEEKKRINAGEEIPDSERTAPSISRSRAELRRTINANAWQYSDKQGNPIIPKFLTLTFKENITSLKQAAVELKKFIRRFNNTFDDVLIEPLKYVCVPEFQERGAVHYHMVLFNLPFLDKDEFLRIRELWPDRFELKAIAKTNDTTTIISYISKYISKQTTDGRFWGQKRYFSSRNLKKPIVLKDGAAIANLRENQLAPYKKYETTIYPPHVESLHYEAYYLGERKNIYSLPLDEYTRKALELSEQGKQEEVKELMPPLNEIL